MKDVVIPYRLSRSGELNYTLRSLKNLAHRNVFIIGDYPSGLRGIEYIPYYQSHNVAKNTLEILKIALDNENISDDFIWMHDDMMILRPIRKIPIYHMGSYEQVIENTKQNNFYKKIKVNTFNLLKEHGVQDPLFFDVHTPFVFNKTKLSQAIHLMNDKVNKISLYANLNGLEGKRIPQDVKVRGLKTYYHDTFVSTHDASFGVGETGKRIREIFKEKSKYER